MLKMIIIKIMNIHIIIIIIMNKYIQINIIYDQLSPIFSKNNCKIYSPGSFSVIFTFSFKSPIYSFNFEIKVLKFFIPLSDVAFSLSFFFFWGSSSI